MMKRQYNVISLEMLMLLLLLLFCIKFLGFCTSHNFLKLLHSFSILRFVDLICTT